VEIHLKLTRIRSAALEYEADFWLERDGGKELVSVGKYQTVNCLYDATLRVDPQIVPASDEFLSKLEVYEKGRSPGRVKRGEEGGELPGDLHDNSQQKH